MPVGQRLFKKRSTEPDGRLERKPSVRETKRDRERTADGVSLTVWDLGELALWGQVERPRPEHVCQGEVGDCVYLSVLAALAHVDPDGLKNRITPLESGRFKVRLDRSVEVGPLIHARPAFPTGLYAYGGESAWVALMEKALAKRKSPWASTPSYEALDGCQILSTALKALGIGVEYEAANEPEPLDGALEMVTLGAKQRRIVLASLDMGKGLEADLHCHAVLAVGAGKVRLYNPHGRVEDISAAEFAQRVRVVCISKEL